MAIRGQRFSGALHEPGAVILSGAAAKNFRPASFAGLAGAESRDPYNGRLPQCGRITATNWGLHAVIGVPRLLASLVARDDKNKGLNSTAEATAFRLNQW